MKQRRMATALILLMIASALLSGALLILYSGHECHHAYCPVCTILDRSTDTFLCLLLVCMGMGLLFDVGKYRLLCISENRVVPGWTLVHRKVKLQD